MWFLHFLANHPTHYHNKEGFLHHSTFRKMHFENGQVSTCQFILPWSLMQFSTTLWWSSWTSWSNKVGQHKLFEVAQSINNLLNWKVQETNNEKEKLLFFEINISRKPSFFNQPFLLHVIFYYIFNYIFFNIKNKFGAPK